jgi:hypothetical protein
MQPNLLRKETRICCAESLAHPGSGFPTGDAVLYHLRIHQTHLPSVMALSILLICGAFDAAGQAAEAEWTAA